MKTLRCAIYTRKSSEEGLEQDFNSLHAQREACEAYVRSQAGEGWIALSQAYDDGGISGGTMDRPGLQRLLADIASGKVDVVVVYKVDRLTRSLMDFAKIVEIFDRNQTSFVSVTQAFNTTSSMGRLTLNVLLSFAQFEREVTGERIRDKLAASKKRGLWMGGNLPLGYDADGRTLKINEPEAQRVREIFERYLVVKSVHRLTRELAIRGIHSKARMTSAGRLVGGGPMRRGALFHLLSNKIYIGEIPHKGVSYPGQHPPILAVEVFEKAQLLLATNRQQRERVARGASSPLAGRIYDAAGSRMSPTSSVGSNGRRYRYYVSSGLQQGAASSASLQRLPAPPLERYIRGAVDRLFGHAGAGDTLETVSRLDVQAEQATVSVDEATIRLSGESREQMLERISRNLLAGERAWLRDETHLSVALPVRLSFRGGMRSIDGPFSELRPADKSLSGALRRAHAIVQAAGIGHVGRPVNDAPLPDTYSRRIASLAFLAPDIQRAILLEKAPAALNRLRLIERDLPLSWEQQRELLGFKRVAR